jgi:hypothetical protein
MLSAKINDRVNKGCSRYRGKGSSFLEKIGERWGF